MLGGIHGNPFLVDAIIGLSVVYKAFDNLQGFNGVRMATEHASGRSGIRAVSWIRPRDEAAGFRAASRGLITNIVSFNAGVEIGQIVALAGVLIALSYWRTRRGFLRHAFVTNTASDDRRIHAHGVSPVRLLPVATA